MRPFRKFYEWYWSRCSRRWQPYRWERWFVTPRSEQGTAKRQFLLLLADRDVCTWCGGRQADAVVDREAVHLNVRPYCQRQRNALREQGRRA